MWHIVTSYCESHITAADAQALERACFFLLHLKMQNIFFFYCTLLQPCRTYDEHTHVVQHDFIELFGTPTLYLVGVSFKPVPGTVWRAIPHDNVLSTRKNTSERYSIIYDFVLVCIHQYYPAAGFRQQFGIGIKACSVNPALFWLLSERERFSLSKLSVLPAHYQLRHTQDNIQTKYRITISFFSFFFVKQKLANLNMSFQNLSVTLCLWVAESVGVRRVIVLFKQVQTVDITLQLMLGSYCLNVE